MRMSAKAEYAVRAMIQLTTVDDGVRVTTDELANAQGIPPQFLVDILSDLRNDRLVRSHRGRDGGYELARPGAEISIADVLRCIDGPLASVRDIGLGDLPYSGPTAALTDVWRALRASMRSVLEQTTLADVAAGALPTHVGQAGRRLPRPGEQAPRPAQRRLTARAVGSGEDLQGMASGVSEVDAATTVVGVDLARPLAARVRPVLQPPRLDLAVDRVEVVLGNQKRVMLRAYLLGRIGVVEGRAVLELHGQEAAERHWTRQPEQLADKLSGLPLVAGGDDGVIESNGHCACQSTTLAGPSQSPQRYFGAVSSRAMLSGSRNSRM